MIAVNLAIQILKAGEACMTSVVSALMTYPTKKEVAAPIITKVTILQIGQPTGDLTQSTKTNNTILS